MKRGIRVIWNEVTKTIAHRRSIRKYSPRPVTAEELETILQCGLMAPTGSNNQRWFVAAVSDPALLKEIGALQKKAMFAMPGLPAEKLENMKKPDFSPTFGAPLLLIVCKPDGGHDVDACLLGENMVLAAESLGLGTCVLGSVTMALHGEEGKAFLKKLGVPEGHSAVYGISVGEPAESPEAKPRDQKYTIIE